jgi:hypothetical protein
MGAPHTWTAGEFAVAELADDDTLAGVSGTQRKSGALGMNVFD